MKRYFALSFLVCLLFMSSCQRDDICPETTQTTPKLVIEFFNFEDVDQPKDVRRLNVVAEGDTIAFFDETTSNKNKISIPLRTDQDFTNYTFYRNYDLSEEEEDEYTTNGDKIQFSYAVNEEYVSRACGYKAEFLDFDADLVSEENNGNWIKNIEVQQPNDILNEQTTHLYIYH